MVLLFKNKFILFVIVFCVLLCGCFNKQDALLSIDSNNIYIEEYNVYINETIRNFEKIGGSDIWDTDFDGKTAFEAAKENALNSIKMVKLTIKRADKNNVKLTENEIKEAENEAERYIAEYGEEAPKNILINVMKEKALYNKVREKILSEYNINKTGFKDFLEENIEYYKQILSKVDYLVIYTKDLKTAKEVYKRAANGEDFNYLANEYMDENNINKTDLVEDINCVYIDTDNLTKGYLSIPQEHKLGYAIYYIENVYYPLDSDISKRAEQDYIENAKNDIFNTLIASWEKEANVVLNNSLFNSIVKETK